MLTVSTRLQMHSTHEFSNPAISSNLTDIFLLDSIENGPVNSNCALANQQILDYSQCFSANADFDGSVLNYTANVVKTSILDGEDVFVGLVEEIFCEPFVHMNFEKTGSPKKIFAFYPIFLALLSSARSFVGEGSIAAEAPEIKLSG